MRRILLIGKNGQVGWELQRTLACLGEVHAFDSSNLNLADPSMIRSVIQTIHPQIVVNAGAYTAVDKAESEKELSHSINAKGSAILADEARRWGFMLVHYSTDYVFDGKSTAPYTENAATGPINNYGQSKLDGEIAIRDSKCKHLIFRTSWVYSNRGKNFLATMLNLAKTKTSLSIVSDQVGAPTWSRSIAEATSLIVQQTLRTTGDSLWGTYHMTCEGETSWHGFAQEIFSLMSAYDTTFKAPEVKAITAAEYPTPAKRPAYSMLDNHKLNSTFNIALPNWKKALELCLQERITA